MVTFGWELSSRVALSATSVGLSGVMTRWTRVPEVGSKTRTVCGATFAEAVTDRVPGALACSVVVTASSPVVSVVGTSFAPAAWSVMGTSGTCAPEALVSEIVSVASSVGVPRILPLSVSGSGSRVCRSQVSRSQEKRRTPRPHRARARASAGLVRG